MGEIELKLLLREPARALWARLRQIDPALPAPRTRTIRSTYFDTPDRRLREAGMTLRIRRDGRRWLQTVKSARQFVGGFTAVGEAECPVPGGRPDPQLVPDDRLRDVLAELCEGRDLQPVSEMAFKRSTLELARGSRIEIAVDQGTITAGDHSAPWQEIELELLEGSPRALFDLAAALFPAGGLRFSALAKSARAELLAQTGLVEPPPAPRRAVAVALDPEMTSEQAARDVMRECAAQIIANIGPVLDTDDPEGPHQLRIGLRRLRSWLSVFRPAAANDESRRLADEARWLGREVGNLRDLDVARDEVVAPQAAAHPEEISLQALALLVAGRVDRRRADLVAVLEGPRAQAFALDLLRFVETRGWIDDLDLDQSARLAAPVGDLAARALRKRWRTVRRRARGLDDLDIEQRHELRKELKKLRYAIEFFAPLYEQKRVRSTVRCLKRLQETFGQLNDAAMARRLMDDPDLVPAADPVLQRAAGWIVGAGQTRADMAWRQAAEQWRDLKRADRFWR